ncbi:MAG: LPS export ABC transporter permease LptG [Succinivibrio sp.]
MLNIIDKYLGKNILIAIILVSVVLTFIATFIHIIDSMRYIGRGQIGFGFILQYVSYKIPTTFVNFAPVSILIGGVIGLGLMSKNSELVIIQSIGMSKLNIGLSCMKTLIPVIALIVFISEAVAPKLDSKAEAEFERLSNSSSFSVTSTGTWIKDSQSIYGIIGVSGNSELLGLFRYELDNGSLNSISFGWKATNINNEWIVQKVIEKTIFDNKVVKTVLDKQKWDLHLNTDRIQVINELSANMPLVKLHDYINYAASNGIDTSKYRLFLYKKIFNPVVMVVMFLLSLSTVFGPLRSISMGQRIVSGIALGFGYYILNEIVGPFAVVYGVYPIIGAMFTSVLFAALAIFLLNRKE